MFKVGDRVKHRYKLEGEQFSAVGKIVQKCIDRGVQLFQVDFGRKECPVNRRGNEHMFPRFMWIEGILLEEFND